MSDTYQHLLFDIPYESYVNAVIGDEFLIQELKIRDDELDVYIVKDLVSGKQFEAQAFSVSCREGQLLRARIRRMKRIFRSPNYRKKIPHGGKKFLISQVERTKAEWDYLCSGVCSRGSPCCDVREEFPPLPNRKLEMAATESTKPRTTCALPMEDQSAGEASRRSYAEVARLRDTVSGSKVPNSKRRPRKRQRRKVVGAEPNQTKSLRTVAV